MIEFITSLIKNEYLATTVLSFVPLIELKGGIVFARAYMDFFTAFGLAYLGSTIAFFPIFFLLIPILGLLKKIKWFNNFVLKVENYFQEKADKALTQQENKKSLKKKSQTLLKQIGVFVFVAIPLPMTGVWTGSAIAVFLGLKFREAVLPVIVGNLVAGLIISLLAEVCLALGSILALDYILYGLFILAIIMLVVVIIKVACKKPTKKDGEN